MNGWTDDELHSQPGPGGADKLPATACCSPLTAGQRPKASWQDQSGDLEQLAQRRGLHFNLLADEWAAPFTLLASSRLRNYRPQLKSAEPKVSTDYKPNLAAILQEPPGWMAGSNNMPSSAPAKKSGCLKMAPLRPS